MGRSAKNKRQRQQRRHIEKPDPPDQRILDSIGSPNAWTPKDEDAWLEEIKKMTVGDIYTRFPPMKKPPSVRNRASGSGWGSSV